MSRSIRLFEIIQYLRQANGPVTAARLAEQLEVTKRTIYRDIQILQSQRLPIDGEAGIGYIMRPGFDLPPLMFNQDEIEAISVGLALLGRTGDQGLQQAAANVAAKIAAVTPSALDPAPPHQVSQWHEIGTTKIEPSDLRRFIREDAELSIKYLDLMDETSQRIIQPIALIYYVEVIVLAAWCNLRQAFRHFRIDRIKTCTATGNNPAGASRKLALQLEAEPQTK